MAETKREYSPASHSPTLLPAPAIHEEHGGAEGKADALWLFAFMV